MMKILISFVLFLSLLICQVRGWKLSPGLHVLESSTFVRKEMNFRGHQKPTVSSNSYSVIIKRFLILPSFERFVNL